MPMRRCALLLVLWVASSPAPVNAKRSARSTFTNPTYTSSPERADLPADLRALVNRPSLASAVADTFHLAWFSFDNGGLPAPQGWISHDMTAQLDTFFHVADSTELDGGQAGKLLPLEGNQSLWCGVVANPGDPFCGWASLPGYGNSWDQMFVSRSFPVLGDVVLSYKVRWDSEPAGYDVTVVEYQDTSGSWVALQVNPFVAFYDGQGERTESLAISAASIGDSVRIRFRFTSDGAWSDEDGMWPTDGAILIDSLTIQDATGAIDFQDFETESPGALATADGDWHAEPDPGYGDFSAMYSGLTVLQEDPCVVNVSNFWAWFDDPSNTPYVCNFPPPLPSEIHPQQGAMPFMAPGFLALNNEIWSPLIPNTGAGSEYILRFRVYRDLPLDNLQFYLWRVRSWSNGCAGRWATDNFVQFGGQKDWFEHTFQIGAQADPGAEQLQLAIGVVDACAFWCGVIGGGFCHSHAPLIDDVHLERVNHTAPQFIVRHINLFQDNFAEDGTITGIARADMAADIAPSASPTIQPGDSVCLTASGIGTDVFTAIGPAVYAYVAVWPPGQAGKAGLDLEAPETRAGVGTRYPLVDSLVHDGHTWYCFRFDSVFGMSGGGVADRYCIDLGDQVFTPCDTICYVFCADDGVGNRTYWSRRLDGQGDDFVTDDLWEALDSPCEFQILPGGGWKLGGDILYVDDTDDRGGPAQLFFDTAFDQWGILDRVDRYDVLAPSSNVGNSLASRVKNVFTQIMPCYNGIIWSSGNLSAGLIGDGTGSPEKSDDYGLLVTFLDNSPLRGGLYFSGDDIHEELAGLTGAAAVDFRTRLYTYTLVDGNHVNVGENISPLLVATGSCFKPAGIPDSLIAFGGCPLINDFDVVVPTGTTAIAFPWPNIGTGTDHGAVLSNVDTNLVGTVMGVVGSGFSFHYIRDKDATESLARSTHLDHLLRWFAVGALTDPVGIDPLPLAVNHLDNAYPNPFNPTTTIDYSIKDVGHVSLNIYNVAGQMVRTLVNEVQTPKARSDFFKIAWDGRNNAGQSVSSGVYFYKLAAKGFTQTKKMVLLK